MGPLRRVPQQQVQQVSGEKRQGQFHRRSSTQELLQGLQKPLVFLPPAHRQAEEPFIQAAEIAGVPHDDFPGQQRLLQGGCGPFRTGNLHQEIIHRPGNGASPGRDFRPSRRYCRSRLTRARERTI